MKGGSILGKKIDRKDLHFKCWKLSSLLSLTIIIFASLNASGAADYPVKSIQIVCPMPPGGGSDIAARIVANKVSSFLGGGG